MSTIYEISIYADECGITPSLGSIPTDGGDDILKELCRSNLYIAVYDFTASKQDEISFMNGDLIIVRKKLTGGWWEGEIDGRVGWFPSNHIEEFYCDHQRASFHPLLVSSFSNNSISCRKLNLRWENLCSFVLLN